LWPNFTGPFGSVFGPASRSKASPFFIEAIFIGIYLTVGAGCRRARKLRDGIPIADSGFTVR